MKKNLFYKKMQRGAAGFLIWLSLMGLAGCATTSGAGYDYNEFLDSYGDYKLVRRNNDVWMEKLDGSEKRQITHTPNVKETAAMNGEYITIAEYSEGPLWNTDLNQYYIMPVNGDDSSRKQISKEEAYSIPK